MTTQLLDRREIQVLSIIENYAHLSPALNLRFSYRRTDVVDTLESISIQYGAPKRIRVHQGLDFISKYFDLWADQHDFVLDFSRPGQPTDNKFSEPSDQVSAGRFNVNWFLHLANTQLKCDARPHEYNNVLPHSSPTNNPRPSALLDQDRLTRHDAKELVFLTDTGP